MSRLAEVQLSTCSMGDKKSLALNEFIPDVFERRVKVINLTERPIIVHCSDGTSEIQPSSLDGRTTVKDGGRVVIQITVTASKSVNLYAPPPCNGSSDSSNLVARQLMIAYEHDVLNSNRPRLRQAEATVSYALAAEAIGHFNGCYDPESGLMIEFAGRDDNMRTVVNRNPYTRDKIEFAQAELRKARLEPSVKAKRRGEACQSIRILVTTKLEMYPRWFRNHGKPFSILPELIDPRVAMPGVYIVTTYADTDGDPMEAEDNYFTFEEALKHEIIYNNPVDVEVGKASESFSEKRYRDMAAAQKAGELELRKEESLLSRQMHPIKMFVSTIRPLLDILGALTTVFGLYKAITAAKK